MSELDIAFSELQCSYVLDGYRIVTDTTATLTISIGDEIYVKVEECLIIEFVNVCRNWHASATEGAFENLYYVSMDEEEEPLFALTFEGAEEYVVESCWGAGSPRVKQIAAYDAVGRFLRALDDACHHECGLHLPYLLERAGLPP